MTQSESTDWWHDDVHSDSLNLRLTGTCQSDAQAPVTLGYRRQLSVPSRAMGASLLLPLVEAKLKALPFGPQGPPPMPQLTYDSSPELVHRGAQIFNTRCMLCHGLNAVGGPLPDLRYSSKAKIESLDQIVLDGVFARAGMPS